MPDNNNLPCPHPVESDPSFFGSGHLLNSFAKNVESCIKGTPANQYNGWLPTACSANQDRQCLGEAFLVSVLQYILVIGVTGLTISFLFMLKNQSDQNKQLALTESNASTSPAFR